MSNPAAMLHEFFSQEPEAQHGQQFAPLFMATVELESRFDGLRAAGANMRPFSSLVEACRSALRKQATTNLKTMSKWSSQQVVRCTLSQSDMDLLELASERIDLTPVFNTESKRKIEGLLAALQSLVVEDESIDPQLRLFISHAIVSIQGELATYSVTGDFNLREALLRLFGLINAAQATSETPQKWQEAWQNWGVPIAQGIIVSMPQIALSAAQVFKAVSG